MKENFSHTSNHTAVPIRAAWIIFPPKYGAKESSPLVTADTCPSTQSPEKPTVMAARSFPPPPQSAASPHPAENSSKAVSNTRGTPSAERLFPKQSAAAPKKISIPPTSPAVRVPAVTEARSPLSFAGTVVIPWQEGRRQKYSTPAVSREHPACKPTKSTPKAGSPNKAFPTTPIKKGAEARFEKPQRKAARLPSICPRLYSKYAVLAPTGKPQSTPNSHAVSSMPKGRRYSLAIQGEVATIPERHSAGNRVGNTRSKKNSVRESTASPAAEGFVNKNSKQPMGNNSRTPGESLIKSSPVKYTGVAGDDMMENKRKPLVRRLAEEILPRVGGGIFLEWRGKERLVAEGIDGLLEYGHTRITVKGGSEKLGIFGNKLEMRYLSETCIVIEGKIVKVCYLPEEV